MDAQLAHDTAVGGDEWAMKDSTGNFDSASSARAGGLGRLAATWLLAVALSPTAFAFAQNAQPAPANAAAAPQAAAPTAPAGSQPGAFPAQPPPAADKPGFIFAFGRWWDSTRGKIDDLRKQSDSVANGPAAVTQDMLKHAAQATKDAATAIARLPGARFIEIHQRCAVAPNGAPDCQSAAANACRRKGFNGGNPIDVQSSQNCSPAVWMSGREPTAGQCPSETVVLMAACN
jgi:hypothetical protein